MATSTLTEAYAQGGACRKFYISSIVHVLASAECLWGTCMHGKQYNQHVLHENDMSCIAETFAVSVGVYNSFTA